jgi:hypothetical protein
MNTLLIDGSTFPIPMTSELDIDGYPKDRKKSPRFKQPFTSKQFLKFKPPASGNNSLSYSTL